MSLVDICILLVLVGTETWIFADKMKKNYINLFTPSLFTWSIYRNNLRRVIQRLPVYLCGDSLSFLNKIIHTK